MDALGVRKVSGVGHFMGGMVGTRFALMFPEQVEAFARYEEALRRFLESPMER